MNAKQIIKYYQHTISLYCQGTKMKDKIYLSVKTVISSLNNRKYHVLQLKISKHIEGKNWIRKIV